MRQPSGQQNETAWWCWPVPSAVALTVAFLGGCERQESLVGLFLRLMGRPGSDISGVVGTSLVWPTSSIRRVWPVWMSSSPLGSEAPTR